SRYSATSVYWLRQEAVPGLSMGSRTVTPGSAPLQSTAVITAAGVAAGTPLYDTVYPSDDGDHFFQTDLHAGATRTITFTLANPVAGNMLLSLHFQGITYDQHQVDLLFDGASLSRQTWQGATTFVATLPIGADQLAAGTHLLRLNIPLATIDAVS